MRKNPVYASASILLLVLLLSCKKEINNSTAEGNRLIEAAKQFYQNQHAQTSFQNQRVLADPFLTVAKKPKWERATVKDLSFGQAVVVPVEYENHFYFRTSFGGAHLFPADLHTVYLIYADSVGNQQGLEINSFPDSNAYVQGRGFSGIRCVRTWKGSFFDGYLYEGSDLPGRIREPALSNSVERGFDVCFSSFGYNYSPADPENGYAWEMPVGCVTLAQDGSGSGAADGWQPYVTADDYSSAAGNADDSPDDIPYIDLFTMIVPSGNNIIGNILDYNKCFNNIAGNGHHYSVTICVEQPISGSREPWGFTRKIVGESADLVNGGHTFLILSETSSNGTITRNVGFYPNTGASPIAPIDQGRLNNDEGHDYNISLTIDLDNSQFTMMLDFIAHGNDNGYNYDLNSNNCSSFAISALRRAGLRIPFTAGVWPNGGGFNPGDLGEDIRTMELRPGMSRSIDEQPHPNSGICY